MLHPKFNLKTHPLFHYIFFGIALLVTGGYTIVAIMQGISIGELGNNLFIPCVFFLCSYKVIESIYLISRPTSDYLRYKDFSSVIDTVPVDESFAEAIETLEFSCIGKVGRYEAASAILPLYTDKQNQSVLMFDGEKQPFFFSFFEDGYFFYTPIQPVSPQNQSIFSLFFSTPANSSSPGKEAIFGTLKKGYQQHLSHLNKQAAKHRSVKVINDIKAWLDWDANFGYRIQHRYVLNMAKIWFGVMMLPLTLFLDFFIPSQEIDTSDLISSMQLNISGIVFLIGVIFVIWGAGGRRL